MKAYGVFLTLKKSIKGIEGFIPINAYTVQDSPEKAKLWLLSVPEVLQYIVDGYSILFLNCSEVPAFIAPMNEKPLG